MFKSYSLLTLMISLIACAPHTSQRSPGAPTSALQNAREDMQLSTPLGESSATLTTPGSSNAKKKLVVPDSKKATDLGFYPLSSPGLPPQIVHASGSVFEIRVLAAGDPKALASLDVTNGGAAKAKAEIQALDPNTFDAHDKIVLAKQVERCERGALKTQKNCVITTDIRRSSAFLAIDASTLWTAGHSIRGFLEAKETYEKISKEEQVKSHQELRVFVFDGKGNLVVDPYLVKVTPKYYPEPTLIAVMRGDLWAEDCDFVGLSLDRAIGQPLALANQAAKINDQVFVLGFPACTKCHPESIQIDDPLDFADRSPGPNSDGHGLKVSSGHVVDNSVMKTFFELSALSNSIFKMDGMLFYTADSQHGQSGGPVLNEKGEVLAVHTGGMSRMIGGHLKRVSRGTVPDPFK